MNPAYNEFYVIRYNGLTVYKGAQGHFNSRVFPEKFVFLFWSAHSLTYFLLTFLLFADTLSKAGRGFWQAAVEEHNYIITRLTWITYVSNLFLSLTYLK